MMRRAQITTFIINTTSLIIVCGRYPWCLFLIACIIHLTTEQR